MTHEAFDELSYEEVDRMERLVAAATAGPWISYVAGREPERASSWLELGVCNELGSFRTIEPSRGEGFRQIVFHPGKAA